MTSKPESNPKLKGFDFSGYTDWVAVVREREAAEIANRANKSTDPFERAAAQMANEPNAPTAEDLRAAAKMGDLPKPESTDSIRAREKAYLDEQAELRR